MILLLTLFGSARGRARIPRRSSCSCAISRLLCALERSLSSSRSAVFVVGGRCFLCPSPARVVPFHLRRLDRSSGGLPCGGAVVVVGFRTPFCPCPARVVPLVRLRRPVVVPSLASPLSLAIFELSSAVCDKKAAGRVSDTCSAPPGPQHGQELDASVFFNHGRRWRCQSGMGPAVRFARCRVPPLWSHSQCNRESSRPSGRESSGHRRSHSCRCACRVRRPAARRGD